MTIPRNDYASTRARRARAVRAIAERESRLLARLRRERPEMFSGSYFLEPVLRWWPDWRSSTDTRELDISHSQRMTATRERILLTGDAQAKWAAIGNIGELRKVRKA